MLEDFFEVIEPGSRDEVLLKQIDFKRLPFEIEALMTFLKEYLRKELENIHRNNIRFQTIGRANELDESVQFELRSSIRKTAGNTGMILNVALNYGGRVELVVV